MAKKNNIFESNSKKNVWNSGNSLNSKNLANLTKGAVTLAVALPLVGASLSLISE